MPEGGNKYYSPTPLDFAVLELLPDKGVLGGLHFAGRPLRHVLNDVNEGLPDGIPKVRLSALMGRLRSMKVQGLVEDFQGYGTRIWARTPQGAEFLARKAEVMGL